MRRRFSKKELYEIRNKIPIEFVIKTIAKLEWRRPDSIFRFRCPLCGGFDTATNYRTNLARCFRCKRNFNTIDTVMLASGGSFVESVTTLKRYCHSPESLRRLNTISTGDTNQEEPKLFPPQSIKEILREVCR